MTTKRINLFLIKDDEIAVLKLHNEKLECLKREGERFQKINEKFWDWWQQKMGYTAGDDLDLCFVWNKRIDIIHASEFFTDKIRKDTCWNAESISLLFESFDIKAEIRYQNDEIYDEEEGGVFYTNLNITQAITTQEKQHKRIPVSPPENETPMQRYYREMKEREAMKRGRA